MRFPGRFTAAGSMKMFQERIFKVVESLEGLLWENPDPDNPESKINIARTELRMLSGLKIRTDIGGSRWRGPRSWQDEWCIPD